MVKRFPRPIKRFPRKCKCSFREIISDATNKSGVVDLNKVRTLRQDSNKAMADKRNNTRKRNQDTFNNFLKVYEEYFEMKFIPNKKTRIVTYKNKEGKIIKAKYKTDFARYIEFYNKTIIKYKEDKENFEKYLLFIFDYCINTLNTKEQNRIFGCVVSEKLSTIFFMRKRKRKAGGKIRIKDRKKKENKHRKLFDE